MRNERTIWLFTIFLIFIKCGYAGLYTRDDYTEILDGNNFYDKVLNKKNAWLVQFYNAWCGHCQNFAPKWKALGADIQSWNETVKLGAIDCSAEENADVCRDYEVVYYPMIKIFGGLTEKGKMGKKIDTGTVDDIEKSVVQFLTSQQSKGKGIDSWANLQPYNDTITNISRSLPKIPAASVIISENRGSIEGRKVILDLQLYKQIHVRRRISNNIKRSKAVLNIVWKNGKQKNIETIANRKEIRKLIVENIGVPEVVLNEGTLEIEPKLVSPDSAIAVTSSSIPNIFKIDEHEKNLVYMIDIENMLSYMFRHEVSLHKSITGEKLDALRFFTEILFRHLPARPPVHSMISKLLKYFLSNNSIEGKDIASKIESLTTPDTFLPQQREWVGCLGSQPRYRGYPCSLWVTFHTLTVNATFTHVSEPINVLRGIKDYVKHFFSCMHCSKHFQEMYKTDAAEAFVIDVNDAVTWLWKSHNKVNNRLKNDATEDPMHKKIYFPSKDACPQCWDNSEEFIEDQVLTYLKNIYHKSSISTKGVQNYMESQRIFKDSEIRICVILYVVFTLVLLTIYYLFCVKFRYKKKATGVHIL